MLAIDTHLGQYSTTDMELASGKEEQLQLIAWKLKYKSNQCQLASQHIASYTTINQTPN